MVNALMPLVAILQINTGNNLISNTMGELLSIHYSSQLRAFEILEIKSRKKKINHTITK